MRVLLLSAYAAGSHRQWRQTLCAMLADWQFEVLELPPRHFNWRARGNALYWAGAEREVLQRDYDLLLATSTVDLATLRGLVPHLARLPSAVYFHENQFAYPGREGQQGIVELQVTSLYTALAADLLLFNSRYNLDSFLAGTRDLLRRLPDYVPAGVVDTLRGKSQVLPVPLCPADDRRGEREPGPLRLQWLGRLEYDKGGDLLLAILGDLEQRELPYELAVTGQQYRQTPEAFATIRASFGHRLVQFGYLEGRSDYLAQLARADIVLSTARQEFQGLAVMEAVQRGACPVVPDRLAYPEIYPEAYRYASLPGDPGKEARAAAQRIAATWQAIVEGTAVQPSLAAFEVPALEARYRTLFTRCAG